MRWIHSSMGPGERVRRERWRWWCLVFGGRDKKGYILETVHYYKKPNIISQNTRWRGVGIIEFHMYDCTCVRMNSASLHLSNEICSNKLCFYSHEISKPITSAFHKSELRFQMKLVTFSTIVTYKINWTDDKCRDSCNPYFFSDSLSCVNVFIAYPRNYYIISYFLLNYYPTLVSVNYVIYSMETRQPISDRHCGKFDHDWDAFWISPN